MDTGDHAAVAAVKPLAIDLFCGLGGWTESLLAEGYYVVGFDIERHEYAVPDELPVQDDGGKGTRPVAKRGWTQGCAISLGMEGGNNRPRTRVLRYPGQLVIQDVLTLHGSQFKDAALIVASPPCQEYSYMAMPWKKAKAKAAAIRADATGQELARLNRLFDACFRIQREACAAAGRHIPMVVENVRGAIHWVGRSRWNFGSFHLWGDVPALMPIALSGRKVPSFRFDGSGRSFQTASVQHTAVGNGTRFTSRDCGVAEGRKGAGAGAEWFDQNLCQLPSKSSARKAASALIAKIPAPLARHIAATFHPARAA